MARYDILSPDGFSIKPNGYFKSIKQAKEGFNQWLKQFEPQGYYSTVYNGQRVRIPLNDVEHNCTLIEKD